jgi:hypothetical protein
VVVSTTTVEGRVRKRVRRSWDTDDSASSSDFVDVCASDVVAEEIKAEKSVVSSAARPYNSSTVFRSIDASCASVFPVGVGELQESAASALEGGGWDSTSAAGSEVDDPAPAAVEAVVFERR